MCRTLGRLLWLFPFTLLVLFAATNGVSGQCTPTTPVANFTQNKDSVVCSGTAIEFYSNASAYKPAYSWDFGNSQSSTDTSSQDTVSYTFINTGTTNRIYHVFLLVIDSCGNLDSSSQNIYVTPALSVNFTIPNGTYACDSLPVSFTNGSSGTALSYSWNFDDPASGSANTSTSANPTHRFDIGTGLDTFFIKLVVSDSCGRSDSITRQLIVSPNPQANFTYTDSLCAGTMAFSNTSSGTGVSYVWNFGDPNSGSANTSTQSSPNHLYDTTGSGYISFPVKLIVTNVYGCKDSLTKNRYVRRGPDATVDDFTNSPPFTQCSTTSSFLLTIDNSSTTSNNVNYYIDWGDSSGLDTLTNFSQDTHTYYGYGLRKLVVRVIDNVGCSKSDTFSVFNGSNPSGGLASPGSTINLCSPIQLGFPLTSVANNPSGTTYTLSVNDGSNPVVYNHPPPDTIYHTFTNGSCGTSTSGSPIYNNAFSVTLTITNPCGFTASSILPITISGKPNAEIYSTHDTACIYSDLVTLRDSSFGATYVQQTNPPGNFTCDTVPLRRWRIDRPTSDYQLVSGYLGGTNFNLNTTVSATGNGSTSLDLRFTDTGRFVISLLSGYPSGQKCGYDSTAIIIYVVDTVVAGFNFSLNPANGCVNNSFTPTNTSVGPVQSYLWTVNPATGFSFQSGNQYSATPTLRFTEAGVFTVNLKVFGFCNDDDTLTTITIRSRPEVTLKADTSYCGPQTLNFANALHVPAIDTNYSSITAYRWRIMGGAISFTGGTDSTSHFPQVQFLDTGYYTVVFTASNACGESVTDTQKIYMRPIPRINGTLTTVSACPGDSIYPPTLISNPPGASFTWTNSNTAIGLGASGSGQIPDFLAAANFTGSTRNALVLITSSLNGCVYVADTLQIAVKPEPVATAISDIIVCPGETVSIPAFVSSPTGASFSWTNSNDSIGLGTSGSGNISSFTAPANNGTSAISGTIRYTPTLNGCVGEPDSFVVSIRTRPTMVALVDTIICPDITFQYPGFNSTPSGASFTWYNSNPAIGLSDSGTGNLASFTSFHNTTASNASAQIRVIPNYNVCIGFADTFTIQVRPAPQIQPTNDTSVCPLDTVFIPAFSASPSGSTFSWTNSSTTTGLAASGTGNITAFPAAANPGGSNFVSQVRVLPSLNACVGYADTFLITVKPSPVSVNMSDLSACPGDTLAFSAFSSTPTGASFVWTNTNAGIGLGSGASGNLPAFVADTNSTGSNRTGLIRYTSSLQGCTGETDSFTITVKPTPVMVAQADVEVCTWETISVANFNSSPAGSTFAWTNSNTAIGLSASGSGNISNYTAPANTSGTVRIGQVRVIPALNLCQGPEDTFEIRILPQPTANAGTEDTLCNGQSTQIGQSAQAGESYSWSSIPAGFTSSSASPQVSPSVSTSYILLVYDSSTTCLQRDTVGILVNPILTNTGIGSDQLICAGQTPNALTGNTPSGGNASYVYQWQQSTDSSSWTNISNANASSFSPGTLQVNTHYRRLVVSGPCSDTSNVVRVIVLPGISNNFITGTDSICAFFAPDTLQGSSPAGGSSSYTYSWQSTSDTTQSASTIGGATGQDYFPGTLSSSTYFRRVVSSGACSVPGNWVEIRVKP
ncbi:MAG TPA: hypothetical protein DIW47_15515, partial [Bacteroidetes bacterium]|nr:hypothetical protein [Bacteroidota bacterium]